MMKRIAGHILEYYDDEHMYLVDGQIVPSITQVISRMYPNKYANINRSVLERAKDYGNEVHDTIERYVNDFEVVESTELHDFCKLMELFHQTPIEAEKPIIVFKLGTQEPIMAGRFDLLLMDERDISSRILADIKTTSVLDKDYLYNQLNLYALGFLQSYNTQIDVLEAIHLRKGVRKLVNIPMNLREVYDRAYAITEDMKNE